MDARKKWLAFGFAALTAALLLLVRYQPTLRTVVADFWSPFTEAKGHVQMRTHEASRFALTKTELIRQIEALEADAANQPITHQRLARLEAENRELRRALHIADYPDYVPIMAQVLTRDPQAGGRRIRIDRGLDAGIDIGQPVTVNGYLLGRVLTVDSNSAVIITVADPNCQVSARITVDGVAVTGILNGRGQDQWRSRPLGVLTYLPRDLTYPEGLDVETSGYSVSIPPGIPIGITHTPADAPMVDTIDQLYKTVTISPYAFAEDTIFVCIWKRHYPSQIHEATEARHAPAPIPGIKPAAPPHAPALDPTDPDVPEDP